MAELRRVSVVSFDDWQILPTRAVPPSHVWRSNARKLPASSPPTMRVQVERRPYDVLRFGAQNCFFRMKADQLDKLASSELGMKFELGTRCPARVLAMVTNILELKPEAALGILELRALRPELNRRNCVGERGGA